jgi:hypothetical protein
MDNIKLELEKIKKSTEEATKADANTVQENLAALNRVSERLLDIKTESSDKKCDTETFKVYKLSTQTPIFKGNSEDDVDRWLYGVEADMNLINMPHNMKVKFLNYYLKNQAFHVWRELVDKGVLDWETFKDEFRKQFSVTNKALIYREKLKELKQRGTVSEYNDTFCELKYNAGKMQDIEALTYCRMLKTTFRSPHFSYFSYIMYICIYISSRANRA